MKATLILLLMAALVSGCAHSRSAEEVGTAVTLPEVPSFLSGPMSVLLTNGGGYSARVSLTTSSASAAQPLEVISGQLLARGDQLFYAPDPQSLQKRLRSVGLSYIWNVKQNQGCVLIEALQGWAPVGFNVHYTNVVATRPESMPERMEGHPCIREAVRIGATEGEPTQFQAWRATDLRGLPVRITGGPGVAPRTLTLSKVRLQVPPADVFTAPDAFTRYENADLMMSELTLRQHNLKKHPNEDWNEKGLAPSSSFPRMQ